MECGQSEGMHNILVWTGIKLYNLITIDIGGAKPGSSLGHEKEDRNLGIYGSKLWWFLDLGRYGIAECIRPSQLFGLIEPWLPESKAYYSWDSNRRKAQLFMDVEMARIST